MTEIYVDADACPVKDEVIRVAARHGVAVHMVGNTWMRLSGDSTVNRVVVSEGPDAADDWIAERAGLGDVVITSDIPLAARCVARKAKVVRPNGKPLDDASMGMALAVRDLHTHLRETGAITRGPAPFTKQDRSQFLNVLETTVRAAKALARPTAPLINIDVGQQNAYEPAHLGRVRVFSAIARRHRQSAIPEKYPKFLPLVACPVG